jgi:hypothetical protein
MVCDIHGAGGMGRVLSEYTKYEYVCQSLTLMARHVLELCFHTN